MKEVIYLSLKYDLTNPQKNIYMVEQCEDSNINNIAGILNFKGNFDEKVCDTIINKVIEINDGLRIRIINDNTNVFQYISEYKYEKIEYVDLSKFDDEKTKQYMDNLVSNKFKFLDAKLYDFKIIRYNKDSGCIFLKAHHIISDAWTLMQIINQLIEMDNSVKNKLELQNTAPSYVEYIESEKEYMNSDKYIKDQDFWREYLKDIKEPFSIKSTTSKISSRANRYSVILNEDQNIRINEYCKQNKVSPYNLFLGALSTYIYRIKDNNDFVIGTPILNRSNFKEKQMMGMFVSTMPIRIKVEENVKFIDLVKQIGTDAMTLFRHQKYPIIKTLEHIHNTTDIKGKIYNIMLSYQNARSNIGNNEQFSTKWIFSRNIQDDLEIHIMDMDNDGLLTVNYDYLTDLFDLTEIEYLHTRIMAIIENAISDLEVNVDNISIMSKEEENKILYEFNDTDTDYPNDKTVIDLFEEQVEKTPDNIALVFENKKMTYRELNEKANQLANYLSESYKLNKSQTVGVLMSRGIELIYSLIAIHKCGCSYIPIDPVYPKDRVKYILNDSNTNILIVNVNIENFEFGDNISIVNINEVEKLLINNTDIKKDSNINENAYIIYTSGSTGNPKGVMITNINLVNFLFGINKELKINDSDSLVSITTISFDIFGLEIWLTLINGAKLVLANEQQKTDSRLLNELCITNNVNIIQTTPTKLNMLISNNKYLSYIENMSKILLGGENLPYEYIKKLKNITKSQIFNVYGPTETTIWSTIKNITNQENITAGKPIQNTKVLVLDSKKRILPIFVEGELVISGDSVSKGYYNNNKLTKEKFLYSEIIEDIIYFTGDLAKFNKNGEIKILGRTDFQVKINGQRIELEEIEKTIQSYKNISNVIVVVKDNSKLLCFYKLENNIKFIDENELKNYLYSKLPLYMVPVIYQEIQDIPLTPNGKTDRKKLLEQENSNIYLDSEIVEKPKNRVQKKLLDILEKKLGVNNIGIGTNIFKYGIDSLSIINIVIEINSVFNTSIETQNIMKCSTIKDIEQLVNETQIVKKTEVIKNLNKYPLSTSAKSVFLDYSINPNSIMYNIPFEVTLENNINIKKLKNSIESILSKNIIFSTRILLEEGNVYQKLDNKSKYKIEILEINKAEYEKEKIKFVKPFDLFSDNLFRINLYVVEKNIYILCDFHHIIFDGSSIVLFLKQIKENYEADINILEYNKILYTNNFIYENNYSYKKAKEYFLSKFSGDLPVNNMVLDYERSSSRSVEGNVVNFKIGFDLKSKIEQLAIKNETTVNSIFLSMFNILLSKYMYSEDIIIGIASNGRKTKEELKAIGMFVKILPFRTSIDYKKSIIDYIKDAKNDIFETLDNDMYNYEDLIRDLKIKRDGARRPLFDIMFVYQNMGIPNISINNSQIKVNAINRTTSKFDITCEVIPSNDEININFEYVTKLYKEDTIKMFGKYYINILEYIVNNSDKTLYDIELMSNNEKSEIINKFTNTGTLYPKEKTIYQLFSEQVNIYSNKDAVVFENTNINYKDLNSRVNQMSRYLLNRGVTRGDVVAIMLDKSIELIISILATLKLGAAYLPIDLNNPKERVKYIIEDSNCKLFINSITYDEYSNYSNDDFNIDCNSDDIAYIMYTSGTTGVPKGVIVTNKNVVRLVKNTNYIDFKEGDKILQTGSSAFDASTFEYWGALTNGLTLHLIKKEMVLEPRQLKEYINNNLITIIWLTAPLFNKIVDIDTEIFNNLRVLLVGGDVLSTKHINKILKNNKNITIVDGYGPTENTTFSTCHIIKREYNKSIPIGKPISNSTCYIYDKCMKLLPVGIPGELFVGGDGVSKGYLNKTELTNEKFIKINNDLLYKTGDLVYSNNNYEIEFLGRIDTQVKINGFRIETNDIRENILKYNNVIDCFIDVLFLDNTKKIICYYKANQDFNIDKLKIFIKELMPLYMIPSIFIKIEDIPLNNNGKVDKSKLPEITINKENDILENVTGVYRDILDSYIEVLNISNINIDDNFFEIGGDSLIAIDLVAKLMNKNINISYGDLFKYPTVKELGDEINNINIKSSISKGIENYDYTKIDEFLKNNAIENFNKNEINKLGNVLLIGSTGFLGAHILDSFLKNEKGNIYCLIRQKNGDNIVDRLKKQLNFFFGNKYDKFINKRIFIVEGDITNNNIFLHNDDKEVIIKNIETVINSAAHIKHFGNLELFNKINFEGAKNITDFCSENQKKLIHISTLSTSGNIIEVGQVEQYNIKDIKYFNETNLYIEQNLDNVYAYTKYLADRYIIEKINNKILNAKIIRVGNLTGRYSDGKFQPNVEENAFANRIKTMVGLNTIPDNLLKFYMEFTPIDYAANAIIKLSKTGNKIFMFNLFNHNHVPMKYVIRTFEKLKIFLNVVNKEDFKKVIDNLINSNNTDKISGIIADLNKNKELEYQSNIIVKSDFTINVLLKLKFKWPKIDSKYIKKYINYLRKIKFLDYKERK
jgi:surfactin family lipopeptide synthetase B